MEKYHKRIAGVLLTAASDLQFHGGLDTDQRRLEAAATRVGHRTGLARAVLGSVADKLVRASTLPVLLFYPLA